MRDKQLQLVLPKDLHDTYLQGQKDWLMSLSQFISLVQERQYAHLS